MKCHYCDEEAMRTFARRDYCQRHWIKRVTGKFPEKPKLPRGQGLRKFFKEHPEALEKRRGITTSLWKAPDYRKKLVASQIRIGFRQHPETYEKA